jgi:chromosome segregation ATPase
MKPRIPSSVISTVLLLSVITYLPGCATTGMERATKTTETTQKVETDYRETSLQINATNASLRELILPSQTDIKKAYDDYAKNVNKMEKLSAQLNEHTEKMQSQREKYFAEWDSSYTNPRIQTLSERRRNELQQTYAKIPEASIGVKGTLSSYLTDIRDIQTYLSNDLTPHGIESIKPIARKAIYDGEQVQESIKPLLEAFDQVKAVISSE